MYYILTFVHDAIMRIIRRTRKLLLLVLAERGPVVEPVALDLRPVGDLDRLLAVDAQHPGYVHLDLLKRRVGVHDPEEAELLQLRVQLGVPALLLRPSPQVDLGAGEPEYRRLVLYEEVKHPAVGEKVLVQVEWVERR